MNLSTFCEVCFEPFAATKNREEDHRPVHSPYCAHVFCVDCFDENSCPTCGVELPNVDHQVNQLAVHLLSVNDAMKGKIVELDAEKDTLLQKTSVMQSAIAIGREKLEESRIVHDALQDDMHEMWTEMTAATSEACTLRLDNDSLRSTVDLLKSREDKIRSKLDVVARETDDFIDELIEEKLQLESEIETMRADMEVLRHKNKDLAAKNGATEKELDDLRLQLRAESVEALRRQHQVDMEANKMLIRQILNAKSRCLKVALERRRLDDENVMLYQDIDILKARNRVLQKRSIVKIGSIFVMILIAYYFGKLVGSYACMHIDAVLLV